MFTVNEQGQIWYTAVMPKVNDISYGIIPVRPASRGFEVLLIHQISNERGDTYWIMPKGHPEKGETPLQAATRELFEETGLQTQHVNDGFPITLKYTFWYGDDHIYKTVTFFVGHIEQDSKLSINKREVKEAAWFSFDEAKKKITHANARRVLEKAEKFLKRKS